MSKEALRLALEALSMTESDCGSRAWEREQEAITALREALAEQPAQQEPVALKPCWYESKEKTMCRKCGQIHAEAIPTAAQQEPVAIADGTFNHNCPVGTPLYTSPPAQRTWVGLTDENYRELHLEMGPTYFYQDYGRAIEAKLKEQHMKTVIEMAREAGFPFNKYGLLQCDDDNEIDADRMLARFAELVRADEREAIIQEIPGGYSVDPQWVCDMIRARSNT